MANLLNPPRVSIGINPDLFDANLAAFEGRFVGISESSRGDRVGIGSQVSAR